MKAKWSSKAWTRLVAGVMASALMPAAADNLTWTETGASTWETGNWQTDGGATAPWTDGAQATITSNGTATASIGDSVYATGLVLGDYTRTITVQGGTLNLANGARIEKFGDYGAVVSSSVPILRQDVPNAGDPRFATCVSGERAWTEGTYGGLPPKNEGGTYDVYTGTNVVYWRNRKLSDICGFASADFRRISGAKCLGAKPYHYQNDGSTASVQFQYRYSATDNYGARVIFTQQGDDILARIDFWRSRNIPDGADFTTQGSGGAQKIWDERTGTGAWTVYNIIAEEKVKDVTVVSSDGADDPAFANPDLFQTASEGAYSSTEKLLWKNRNLEDIEFKCAFGRNASGSVQKWALPYNRKIEADGKTSVQFRYYHNTSGGVLCWKVLFRQQGSDIYAQIWRVGARTLDINRDWDDPNIGFPGAMAMVYDGNLTTTGWGLCDIKATRKTVAPLEFTNMNELPENLVVSNGELKVSSGADIAFKAGTYDGDGTLHLVGGTFTQTATASNAISGKLIFDGTKCLVSGVTGNKVCGSGAEIQLINGGELVTTNASTSGFGTSDVKMYIGPGSRFSENGNNFNLNSVALTVDGGTCEMNNAVTYIEDMTVRNGAQITERGKVGSFWFGRLSHKPKLTCDGTNEVTIASRLRLYKDQNGSWNPNVQYLTVNTLADLRLTGGFMMSSQTQAYYNGMRIRKTGPAKLIFDYSQDDFPADELHVYTLEQCVDEGTLELAKSAAFVDTEPVSLYGTSALQVDAGTTNAGALLTVGGTNVIGFAESSALSFTNLTIAADCQLSVTGEVSSTSFRIGTTRCLSHEQLSKIRINDRRPSQNSSGYLVVGGLTIYIR